MCSPYGDAKTRVDLKRNSTLYGAETNCRIAHNLGILLMNSNCFAINFQQHSSYECSDIYNVRIVLNKKWTACINGTKQAFASYLHTEFKAVLS